MSAGSSKLNPGSPNGNNGYSVLSLRRHKEGKKLQIEMFPASERLSFEPKSPRGTEWICQCW